MEQTVIRMEQVGKDYELGRLGGADTLQGQWREMTEGIKKRLSGNGGRRDKNQRFSALQSVSLEIRQGERIGLIGRNGAGKSTLLKLLSRITVPDRGRISINGRVAALLEVGTGFHRELTGRENIYLNGAILGMRKEEIEERISDIIEFSECGEFLDTPVKRYSSGMYVKLAFSVAAHLNADIFLMDEVLAVGDMQFQKKCIRKMREISEDRNKTILYVSHNMQTVRELCDRCIVLDRGQIIHDGDTDTGIRMYMKDILEVRRAYDFTEQRKHNTASCEMLITRIEVDEPVLEGEARFLEMRICFNGKRRIRGMHIRFTVHDEEDNIVGTALSEKFTGEEGTGQAVQARFDTSGLASGAYSADIAFVEPYSGYQKRHDYIQRAVAFRIRRQEGPYKVDWLRREWGSAVFPRIQVDGSREEQPRENRENED